MWDLVPCPGMEAGSLNHWTTKDVPVSLSLNPFLLVFLCLLVLVMYLSFLLYLCLFVSIRLPVLSPHLCIFVSMSVISVLSFSPLLQSNLSVTF